MPTVTTTTLRQEVTSILRRQGYLIKPNGFFLLKNSDNREIKRKAHLLAKSERISAHEDFILNTSNLAKKYMIDGKDLDVEKIKPKIIEVQSGTQEEDLFRWWNLIWWSLPYEHAYGRQMRFIIWDQYHDTPIGLIGLQSPILSWSVRDNYLGILNKKRDFWVNQSLNAQRIGALPPYNDILGGKLVTLLMTSNVIRKKFEHKYINQKTILKKRKLPPRLLFITTTGAYGKSSVYERLKFKEEKVVEFIGFTKGSGTFHVPNALYGDLIKYLKKRGYDVRRGYGSGPSRKLRLIDQALQSLGFVSGATHGIKRAVYLFPSVKNLKAVIQENKKPVWNNRTVAGLTDFWKSRWAIPRSERNKNYLAFSADKFMKKTLKGLKEYKQVCRII